MERFIYPGGMSDGSNPEALSGNPANNPSVEKRPLRQAIPLGEYERGKKMNVVKRVLLATGVAIGSVFGIVKGPEIADAVSKTPVGEAVGKALNAPEPSIEAGKKAGAEFKASGGNIPTGRRLGEVEVIDKKVIMGTDQPVQPESSPTLTPPLWERPAGTPPPGISPSTVDERAKQYIQTQTAKPK